MDRLPISKRTAGLQVRALLKDVIVYSDKVLHVQQDEGSEKGKDNELASGEHGSALMLGSASSFRRRLADGFLDIDPELQLEMLGEVCDVLNRGLDSIAVFRGSTGDGMVGAVLRVLPRCLPAVATKLLSFLGIFCKAGVAVRDVKALFRKLAAPHPHRTGILSALRNMMHQGDASPKYFFNFVGSPAGLQLDEAPWPFERGYSVWTWVRIQQWGTSSREDAHLFTFECPSKSGGTAMSVDVQFSGKLLMVCITDSRGHHSHAVQGPVQRRSGDSRFELNQW